MAETLYLVCISASAALLRGDGERCGEILLTTPWDVEDANLIFQAMNEVLGLLGFEVVVRDVAVRQGGQGGGRKKVDELDSYEALVREAGY